MSMRWCWLMMACTGLLGCSSPGDAEDGGAGGEGGEADGDGSGGASGSGAAPATGSSGASGASGGAGSGGAGSSSSSSASGGGPCDGIACDAPPANHCTSATELAQYPATGSCADGTCTYAPTTSDCGALGCCTDHCCAVSPSNGADLGGIGSGPTLALQDGDFDTSSECNPLSVLGACSVVTPVGSPEVCVCHVGDLALQSLTVTGTRALAIFASGTVTVTGTLSVSGATGVAGPGATHLAFPGGAGSPAAGGSFGTFGGGSGAAATFGTPKVVPLAGGMAGQSTCNGWAGGGGGALQITAGVAIEVAGAIRAGGGGGAGGPSSCCPGSGGGSGGAILLEAPLVSIWGVLAANGGAGGSGADDPGNSADGEPGLAIGGAAWGGLASDGDGCALWGYTSGGDGGNGSSFAGSGQAGQAGDEVTGCFGYACIGSGGGGGGAGRIRINSDAAPDVVSAVISPPASFGDLEVQ